MQRNTLIAIVACCVFVLCGQFMLHQSSKLQRKLRSQREDRILKDVRELEVVTQDLKDMVSGLHGGEKAEKEEDKGKTKRKSNDIVADSGKEDTTPLEAALEVWKEKSTADVSESCTKTKDFQSSKLFHDFLAPKHGGWRVPTSDGSASSPCNPLNFNPTAAETQECIAYLADIQNWKFLRPMDSVLAKARTIKFIVQTKDPEVRAIIKIPQFKFIVEPYSEYAAFTLDKVLETNRVPPTAWVAIPVNWLRASMSVLMPDIYVQWVECFVFKKKGLSKLLQKWDGAEEGLYTSVQLWMKGVRELHDTSLRLHHHLEKYYDPGEEYSAASPIEEWAIGEQSDLQVFDHIIGNNDRTPLKNAFAVGKCDEGWDCTSLADTRRFPHMVYLDQGSSFYSREATRVSVFKSEESRICRFRKKTYTKVKELEGTGLFDAFKAKLPAKGFWIRWETWQAEGAQTRLNQLWKHIKNCESEHGKKIFLD
eukprot:TRINITY_DN74_c3_g1_i2.p2 TRINITY_DN74_c3_g1~~TRINITY_DN74_c3_g1_i2.p2  ORF type:complete len:480 (+),score=152.95 TRINITY_DN74_c3_g1_i2:1827-3266(+)